MNKLEEKPSKIAKLFGLESLKQASDLCGVSVQTLINWHKNKPILFLVVLKGCRAELEAAKYRETMKVKT